MLVKAMIEIPPTKGHTVIPRLAMVSTDGKDFVFVKKPATPSPAGRPANGAPERFERRALDVAQENHDRVIVAHGLEAGEEVAADGSLILAQVYEDTQTAATGLPLD
jgi:cobalt-zinc-cadmium efflux system membrane fusion protein